MQQSDQNEDFHQPSAQSFYPLMKPSSLTKTLASRQKCQWQGALVRPTYHNIFLFVSLGILLQLCAETQGFARGGNSLRVLMVGDSLTVGGFGDAMQDYLLKRFGKNHVAVYASCGSSPEQWIRSGPNFVTKCGYREQTPRTTLLYDFHKGRRPRPVLTPKLEDLVARYHPKTVIVQLGTNWMDGMSSRRTNVKPGYDEILDRFVAAIRSTPNSLPNIIWITPPDSSRYSKAVQTRVKDLITAAAGRRSFEIIDSSRMTHYVRGKSGSDGVHYNGAAAQDWANRVMRKLDRMLR
jgi:hypothetical protein